MLAFKILFLATASGLVNALPEPTAAPYLDARGGPDCAKVTAVLSAFKQIGPLATSFCSDYLNIKDAKKTTTITPAAVTRTTSTTTITTTKPSCDKVKRDAQWDYLELDPDAEGLERRGGMPDKIKGFAAAKISDGCRCLNLQPKTKTITKTAATPTTKVVATATQCVVQAACKPAVGFGSTCVKDADCCSGKCGSTFDSTICCTPNGGYCDLNRPDGCCSGTCLNTGDINDLDGTCI